MLMQNIRKILQQISGLIKKFYSQLTNKHK
jgi:hypothetical protein